MSKVGILGFNPIWYFANNTGKPNGAGKMFTYSSLNPGNIKNVYYDPGLTNPYPQGPGIDIDLNGTISTPMYFEYDPNFPNDLYYIVVQDFSGNVVTEVNNYIPSTGVSGGGTVIEYLPLTNYITNNLFWRNCGSYTTNTSNRVIICPGNHSAFEYPDIAFEKSSVVNTDSINFRKFSPFGNTPFTGDVTPPYYLNYTCNTSLPGEIYKRIRIPVIPNVTNFSNQIMTITIWAKSNSGPVEIGVYCEQYFGYLGSATVETDKQIFTLNSDWQKFTAVISIPSVTGKVVSVCENDGFYFMIDYPLNQACNIDIAKPSLYLGSIDSDEDYTTYDNIDAIINAPRTGTVQIGMTNLSVGQNYYMGYVGLGGGSIGNQGSGATQRADSDTYYLYKLLWEQITSYNPVNAPSKGASPQQDFASNITLNLPPYIGYVIAGSGGNNQGSWTGTNTQTLTVDNLPPHNHPGSVVKVNGQGVSGTEYVQSTKTGQIPTDFPLNIASQGSAVPFSIVQPTVFNFMYMKL